MFYGVAKSIHGDPVNHAARGDERIRTAVPSLGADWDYVALGRSRYPKAAA